METRTANRNSRNNPANGRSNRSPGNHKSRPTGRSGSSNRNNKKRKRQSNLPYQKIAIGGVFLMIAITCVVWASKAAGDKKQETEEEETTLVIETELQKEVMVDGIRITGMSREQAKEAILKQYIWDMKVMAGEPQQEYAVHNLMEGKVSLLLDEIFTKEPRETYTLDTSGLEEFVTEEVKRLAKETDVAAVNGALTGFDKNNGSFIYAPEVKGKAIDQDKLAAEMNQAIEAKEFDAVLVASMKTTEPEITMAQAKQMYKVIGTYTTKTTSNKERNTNIRLAAEALDGLIIKPGQEFSFNKTTGNRTLERGYRPAGAYVNGVLVEEPGGGVCQVSSTLYNAVVFSGLTTKERHAHSFEPNYVTPGEDAMVSYDGYAGPDMRFLNNSKDTVAIRAKFSDQTLTISIVGIPILESGVTLKMKSHKTGDVDPPAPIYEEDQSLQPNVEVQVKAATPGSKWVTNLVTMKNGEVISDVHLHNSTYKGKAATIKRNTSGTVVPKEGTTVETSATIDSTESSSALNPTDESGTIASSGVTPTETGTQPTTSVAPTLPTETQPAQTVPVGPGGPAESDPTIIAPNPNTQVPVGP